MYLEGQPGHHLFFLCEGSVELSMCMLTEKMKQEVRVISLNAEWFLRMYSKFVGRALGRVAPLV
jgi:hypothetical protein